MPCRNLHRFSTATGRYLSVLDRGHVIGSILHGSIKYSLILKFKVENINEKRSANYFVRHWRGDLSLTVSFWLNTFLPMLAIYGVTYVLDEHTNLFQTEYPGDMMSIFVYLYLGIFILIALWQNVGLWRSAGRYGAATGGKVWTFLVQYLFWVLWFLVTGIGVYGLFFGLIAHIVYNFN